MKSFDYYSEKDLAISEILRVYDLAQTNFSSISGFSSGRFVSGTYNPEALPALDTFKVTVMPNWIDHFESDYLVPPAKLKDRYEDLQVDGIWSDPHKDRFIIIDGIIIITGM